MNLLQRTLATLSAASTAALMTLPVLAQTAPINNGTNSNTVDCSFINGGIGGPVENQASGTSGSVQSSPSSYDTASSGVQGNTSVPLGNASAPTSNSSAPNSNSNVNRFPNEGSVGQSTIPAPTSNSTVNQSPNQGNINRGVNANRIDTTTYHAMMQVTRSPEHRQFDGNNPSAAVAFRSNGPAGTSGHEAKMNLNAFQDGQSALRANNLSASTPLPIACAPRQ